MKESLSAKYKFSLLRAGCFDWDCVNDRMDAFESVNNILIQKVVYLENQYDEMKDVNEELQETIFNLEVVHEYPFFRCKL